MIKAIAPWDTIIDRARYFNDAKQLLGQPLQQDRHPLTGAMFENLFALRRAKLAALLGHLNRGCTCAVLRLEQVQADPETAIAALRGLTVGHQVAVLTPGGVIASNPTITVVR